jgi:glycosyltransferase involved in cell wall biosynthesis
MKFLFFAGGTTVTGMEVALVSLMSRLNAMGHRATAIVSGWNDGVYPPMLRDAGIDHHLVYLGRIYRNNPDWTRGTLYELRGAAREIRSIAGSMRPHWMVFGEAQSLRFCSRILPWSRRALYLHGEPERIMRHPIGGHLIGWRVRRILCVSEFLAQEVRRTPLRRVPLSVVHNGTPVPPAQRAVSSSGPVRLGIIGRISEQKRHATLLEALARLPANAFHLSIVGGFSKPLEERIAALGLAGQVSWTGFVNERAAIYRELDIVVAPAVDEGFGMTAIEAGAQGLPVVAARSGGFPEVIRDSETGLLVEPDDAAALAQALRRLITDAGLRERLGHAARAHVAASFTVDQMAERFVAALGD